MVSKLVELQFCFHVIIIVVHSEFVLKLLIREVTKSANSAMWSFPLWWLLVDRVTSRNLGGKWATWWQEGPGFKSPRSLFMWLHSSPYACMGSLACVVKQLVILNELLLWIVMAQAPTLSQTWLGWMGGWMDVCKRRRIWLWSAKLLSYPGIYEGKIVALK